MCYFGVAAEGEQWHRAWHNEANDKHIANVVNTAVNEVLSKA